MEERFNFSGLVKSIEEYLLTIELSQNEMSQVNRILYKLRNIEAITSTVDEELYNVLIENNYKNLESYCKSFISGQHNYINNLQTVTTNISTDLLRYIDFNMLLGNKSGIKKNIRNYKYELTKQNNLVEAETSQLLENIKDKKEELESKDSDLNKSFDSFGLKLEELEKKYSELSDDINILLKQSTDKIDDLITKEKEKLEDNYNNESQSFEEKFDSTFSSYAEKFEELSNEYKEKYETLYNEIKAKDEQISKLLDIVGDKARVGEYKKNADSSRTERIVWQILTIALFVGAFVLLLYVTFSTKIYDKFTIIKYIVSAILMGAATYTGKQASNSRKDEVYYRKQELELASIDTYLETMNPNIKDEIKKELSSKIFGQAQSTYTNKYDERKGFATEDIIKIIEAVRNKV